MKELFDLTVSGQDFKIVRLVYRKWWNPMRYIKGLIDKKRCIVKFVD